MLFGFIFFVDFRGIFLKFLKMLVSDGFKIRKKKEKVVLAADTFRALCTGDQPGLSNRLLVELFT